VASVDIRLQCREVGSLRRRASARNRDGLTVGAVDSTIAVAGSSGVDTALESEGRSQRSYAGTSIVRRGRRSGGGGGGCGSSRCGGRSSGRRRGSILDGFLLGNEGRRGCGAALAGTIEVLKGHEGRVDASELGGLRVVGREGDSNGRVVHGMAGGDIGVEVVNECLPVRRACAGHRDGLTVGAVNSTIAVSRTGGVNTRVESKLRDQGGVHISLDGNRRHRREEDSSSRDQDGREFHFC